MEKRKKNNCGKRTEADKNLQPKKYKYNEMETASYRQDLLAIIEAFPPTGEILRYFVN